MVRELQSIFLELIVNLIVTVIVIDRVFAWRERRRWRNVGTLVELQLEAVAGDILRSWATWLTALRKAGKQIVLSEDAKTFLKEEKLTGVTVLPSVDFEDFVGLCAGQPVPIVGEASFVDSVNPNNFHRELANYLVTLSLEGSHLAWKTLVKEFHSSVPKLAELLERFPKDKTTGDEIGYRQLVEELHLLIRRIDPSLYSKQDWDDEQARLPRMIAIARSIAGLMLLIKVFRTSRNAPRIFG